MMSRLRNESGKRFCRLCTRLGSDFVMRQDWLLEGVESWMDGMEEGSCWCLRGEIQGSGLLSLRGRCGGMSRGRMKICDCKCPTTFFPTPGRLSFIRVGPIEILSRIARTLGNAHVISCSQRPCTLDASATSISWIFSAAQMTGFSKQLDFHFFISSTQVQYFMS